MLRSLAKEAVLASLGSKANSLRRIGKIQDAGHLTILNLHRVAPAGRTTYPPLDPSLFEYLVSFVSTHFEVVTFSDLGTPSLGGKPPLILSFDDAYKDFLEYAVPILEKHKLRVNQNVIPRCVETAQAPLNVVLQDYLGQAPTELIDKLEVPGFKTGALREPRHAFGNRLSMFLKNKPMAEQQALADILLPQVAEYQEFGPTPMMSLDEIRQISGIHELGAHSYDHASMAEETDAYLAEDVARCRRWMAANLGVPLKIYALPNGSYRPSQIAILRKESVEHILLVDEKFSSENSDVHHRITFDARSKQEVRFRATGAYALFNGRAQPR